MTKKVISLVISLLILLSCVYMPTSTVMAADEGFTFTQNFDGVTLADETTDLSVVSQAIGLDVVADAANTFAFSKTADGKLKVEAKELYIHSPRVNIAYNFEAPVKKGVVTVEMSISSDKGDNWHTIFLGGTKNTSSYTWTKSNSSDKFQVVYSRFSENDDWLEERYFVAADGTKTLVRDNKMYSADEYTEFSSVFFTSPYLANVGTTIYLDDISVTYETVEELSDRLNFSNNFDGGQLDMETSSAAVLEETGLTVVPDTVNNTKEGDYKFTTKNGKFEIHREKNLGIREYTMYKLPLPIGSGKFTVKFNYQPTGSAGVTRYIFAPVSATGTASTMLQLQPNPSKNINATVGTYANQPAADDSGVYHFRMEIARNDKYSDWYAVLYDDVNPNFPKMLISKTYAKEDYPSLSAIRLFGDYAYMDANTFANAEYTDGIDDLSIVYEEAADITETAVTEDFSNVTSSQDVSASVLSEETGFVFEEANDAANIKLDTTGGSLHYTADNGLETRLNIWYNLPAPITKGYAEVGMKFKRIKTVGRQDFFAVSDNRVTEAGKFNTISGFGGADGALGSTLATFNATTQTNGFNYLRLVVSRPDETANWLFTVYDETLSKLNPTILAQKEIAAADLEKVSRVRLFTNYVVGTAEVEFDDLFAKVSYYNDVRKSFSQNLDEVADVTYDKVTSQALADYSQTGGFPMFTEQVYDHLEANSTIGIKDGTFFATYDEEKNQYSRVRSQFTLPAPLYYGFVEGSMRLNIESIDASTTLNLFGVGNNGIFDDSGVRAAGQSQVAGNLRSTTAVVSTGNLTHLPVKDNGFFNLAFAISRKDAQSDWTIRLFDKNNGFTEFNKRTISKDALERIDHLYFFNSNAISLKFKADDFSYRVSPYYQDAVNLDENFDDIANETEITLGASQTAFLEETGLLIEGSQYGIGTFTVNDGVLKLDIDQTNGYQQSVLKYILPVSIPYGTITMKAVIPSEIVEGEKVAGVRGTENRFFSFNDEAGLYGGNTIVCSGTAWSAPNSTQSTGSFKTKPLQDENGNYVLRAVIKRADAASVWQTEVYDDSQATPVLVATRETTAAVGAISKITIANACPGASATILLDSVSVSYDDGSMIPAQNKEEAEVVIKKSDIVFSSVELTDMDYQPIESFAGLTEVYVRVTAANPKGTNDKFTIVAAAYSGGRLLAVSASEPIKPTDEETFELYLTGFSGADNIKVFMLNDMGSIRPLSDLGVDGGLSPIGFQ